jgi:hypothetical protein
MIRTFRIFHLSQTQKANHKSQQLMIQDCLAFMLSYHRQSSVLQSFGLCLIKQITFSRPSWAMLDQFVHLCGCVTSSIPKSGE